MFRNRTFRTLAVGGALVLTFAACSDDDEGSTDTGSETTEAPAEGGEEAAPADSSTICDTDGLVAAVEGGPEEGTLEGMTDDPVGTAASSNPVLTTLVTAVTAADLVSTLDGAEALTVFAPTDCAFAQLDPATLEAALADPSGLLTTVLGFHVITERLEPGDLETGDLTTFTGATLPIEVDGDTITLNGGQATVLVPGIQTANATVYLIDNVMLPPAG
jgi:uncharacterized surface protein with fasciclin (FAS1) repeats